MDELGGIDAYMAWAILGLVLAGLEMLVPGIYLVWLALAALATAAIVFVGDPPVTIQVISFVFLALIIVFSARRMFGPPDAPGLGDPLLNNRGARMVGEIGVVTQAIADGKGRVKVGDSEWLARGPDIGAGTRVRITGASNTALVVEAMAELPPADS